MIMIVYREHDSHREIKSVGRCEVVQRNHYCREMIVDDFAFRQSNVKLGGPGKIVQIDESKFGRCQQHDAHGSQKGECSELKVLEHVKELHTGKIVIHDYWPFETEGDPLELLLRLERSGGPLLLVTVVSVNRSVRSGYPETRQSQGEVREEKGKEGRRRAKRRKLVSWRV
ncbi:unnamed protein product [Callosobruchus maculatus]|uniref:Uncharacterized protein n=1 Tax=Callosobruchus maculatus TaxID=64391 RepID=A0A653CB53_CALMS|nr:unnamed protein product [Callosobruchus maculatus]